MPNTISLAPPGVAKVTHDPTKTINGDPLGNLGDNPFGQMSMDILFGGVNTTLQLVDYVTGFDLLPAAQLLESLFSGSLAGPGFGDFVSYLGQQPSTDPITGLPTPGTAPVGLFTGLINWLTSGFSGVLLGGVSLLEQLIGAAGGTGNTLGDFGTLFANTTAALENAIISVLGGTGTGIPGVEAALEAIPTSAITGLDNVLDGLDLSAARPIVDYVLSVANSLLDQILRQSANDFTNVYNSIVSAMGGTNTGQSVASMFTALQNIPGVNIVSTILASIIPGFDASKMISGLLDLLRIPSLPASQTTSGTFLGTLIPSIDGSKIGSGTVASTFLPSTAWFSSIAASLISGVLTAFNIPSIDASKMTTGLLDLLRIPTLPQSQTTNLTTDLAARPATTTSPNLVADGAFTTSAAVAPWISWGPFNSGPVWDNTQGHTAVGSLRQPSDGGCDLTIPALPGQTFSISLWAKGSVTGGGMYVGVYNISTAGTGVSSAQDSTFHPTTAWAQYTATFTAPAGSGGFVVEIGGDWSGNSVWLDDVVVNQTNVLATAPVPNNVAKSQNLIDNLFNAFTAQSGIANATLPDAFNVMTSLFGQLNTNTRKIQDMTAVTGGKSVSGSTVTVDFSNYADGPLPSIFTTTYSGTGTSTLGIKSGQSQWTTQVNDNDRSALVIYNVAPTNTDFQIVRGTMTQAPNDGGISGNPRVSAVARCNSPSAPTSFVWARGYSIGWMQWHADIGCTVAGVETVWATGIALTWAMDMYFQAGVGTNARQYQLWSGNTVVYTHNEVGTVSNLGAGYRYWGAKSEIRKGNFNPITSGQIGGCATSDNAPPTYVGSGAMLYRTNTAQTTANNGATNYVSNGDGFFNNSLTTPDITVDGTWGGFQVSVAGWYVLKAAVKTSTTAFPNRITLRILGPSNAAKIYGAIDHMRGLNSGSASTSPRTIGDSWLIYMAAGDSAYLGYDCDGGGFNTANVFTGEATGLQTYFTIGLANKSTN